MPSAHRNVTVVAAFVTVLASVAVCGGCASGSNSAGTAALAASTSGADPSTSSAVGADDPDPVESEPVESDPVDVRSALGASDVCALYDRMESMSFDEEDPAEFADQLTRVAEVMDEAVDLVDPELHDDWARLADGAREMASQLRAHPDDRKKAAAVLARPELIDAGAHIDEWMDEHCT